jgi:pimeloyl-ACP methyl ester carboxylesterase
MTHAVSTVRLASGLTLSYAEAGDEAGPVVVFLPGPTDSWRSYEQVLGHLAPSRRAIAVSARGHGDSDKPATGYDVTDFAADVVALLDGLDIEGAVLVGHSASCLVARRVAIDHDERVAGLVLEASPTTLRGDAGLEAFVTSVLAGLEDPLDEAFARSLVADTSVDGLAADVLNVLVAEVLKVPVHVWREMFAGLLVYDDLAELMRITAPTLLVWGDADGLVGHDKQETLATRIAGSELIVYVGAGHTPRWEHPARFARDIDKFVERSRR